MGIEDKLNQAKGALKEGAGKYRSSYKCHPSENKIADRIPYSCF